MRSLINRSLRSIARSMQPFLEPGAIPILFLVGATLLGVIGNSVYDFLSDLFGTPGEVFAFSVTTLAALVIIYAVYQRYASPRIVVGDAPASPREGLIVLVSQGIYKQNAAVTAIKYHLPRLKYCWLLTSGKPGEEPSPGSAADGPYQSAYKNAEDIQNEFQATGRDIFIREIDPEDPRTIYKEIEAIYQEARRKKLLPSELVADYTGGTKSMTAGMVLGSINIRCYVEYFRPLAYGPDGRIDFLAGSEAKFVDLSFLPGFDASQE